MATTKGFLRCIYNEKPGSDLTKQSDQIRQSTIALDQQSPILEIFLFTKKNHAKPSLYYITKKGIHFMAVIDPTKKATIKKSIAAP